MNRAYPGLGAALALLALGMAGQLGLASLWIEVRGSPATDFALMTGVVNFVALTSLAIFGFWRSREAPPFRGFGTLRFWFWVGLFLSAIGGTVVLSEVSNVTMWVLPLPRWLARVFSELSGGPPLVSLFALAFVAPVTEEALFRGLLLRGFARRYGPAAGIVLSSALFALFHLNIWQALTAFLAGLYLGWIFVVTRSLVPPMVAHALFNGVPVLLAAQGFVVLGYNSPAEPGPPTFQPVFWTLGGLLTLVLGLWLTLKWAPLFPRRVSDKVQS